MNPYPYYWRGPSRIVWFLIGAGTATWWIKHRDVHHFSQWGHCRRLAIENATANANMSTTAQPANGSPESSFSFKDIPRTINNIPPAAASWNWGWGERKEAQKYQEEQDNLAELRRQATDAMTEMTEATLDSILAGAEALKVKLAESREQRKKQEALLQKQIEEQSRNPPRLI
ncbi:hypothetical protein P691DRAFT_719478 [Macrolepiota fuliginosa MF-IS2]|uniref:Uncharacterized protein n=1 Tax=Macrolepiota fuliginosa MF-IS2 TaxID=1400762 RepID=A0A9P5XLI6_9AGAR|nr:hypothetical protein P691DRAFT_719478 [Macrolepiota fuliginosa MF-IS2]